MSYCVNCAAEYDKPSSVCEKCHLDQRVPEEVIDSELLKRRDGAFDANDLGIGYPGEVGALRLAIVLFGSTVVALGALSVGIFLALVAGNLVNLRLRHLASKGNMLCVSEVNFKDIFRMAKVAAFRLRLPLPPIYVTQDPGYNAYATGFYRYGFIVLHSSLVRDFRPLELLFVIGHEMGHMKRHHTTWLTLLEPARAGGARFLLAPLMRVLFNVWSVKAEFTADQAGLVACSDPDAACLSLLRLAGGADIERHADVSSGATARHEPQDVLSSLAEYLGTHPFIQNRVKHLRTFAASAQYRASRWWETGERRR